MTDIKSTLRIALAVLLFLFAGSTQAAVIYVVNGDTDTAYIVDTDAGTFSSFDTSAVGRGYAIAVTDTVIIGDRDDTGAVEYALDGTPTGNSWTGGSNFSELLDGTTDGTSNNYGIECCGATNSVTVANLTWEAQAVLFDLPGNFDGSGITFDSATGTLWTTTSDSDDVRNFALDGTELSSFTATPPSSVNCCLAYDSADDTLWIGSNGSNVLRQYSTAGALLDTVTIAGWSPGNIYGAEISIQGTPQARATFLVSKTFDDGNTTEVEVTLSCNTGLPLEQSADISEGDGVNFVVVDFNDGEMDCTVTETAGADGYSVSYFDGSTNSDDNCTFEGVGHGDAHSCRVDNELDPVEIEVTKVWIDENPQFSEVNIAEAEWECTNVSGGGTDDGRLDFFADPDIAFDEFFVLPDWESGTTCSVTEVNLFESGVEVDDSDCQGLVVFPGAGASCTIFNTRLFAGIPTLSQYGLGLLALLMLGVGLIGFRRFI